MNLMNLFGCNLRIMGEQEMRLLVKMAGGDPDEWETCIVFSSDSLEASCSRGAFNKLRAATEPKP